nr:hypothetical protein [uncultured Sphingomonas sp.]
MLPGVDAAARTSTAVDPSAKRTVSLSGAADHDRADRIFCQNVPPMLVVTASPHNITVEGMYSPGCCKNLPCRPDRDETHVIRDPAMELHATVPPTA